MLGGRRGLRVTDAGVCLVFLALGFWVTQGLWPDPTTRTLAQNPGDQTLNEWFLANGVLFWNGDLQLHTLRLNVPDGVNLMGNASIIGQGIVLAPVTALFGAPVSFAVLLAANLAGTAAGWYLLFARGLGRDRVAAMVGGLVAGFGPGMISQSIAHPHMTSQWLVPLMVWCVIRLTRAGTGVAVVTSAVGLAAAVSAQVFLGEEVLYLAALTLALFTLAYAGGRPQWTRKVAPTVLYGLMIAVGVSLVVLAYPLWMQLAGPQHTPTAPFAARFFFADLAGYFTYSPLSLAGTPEAMRLATGPTELNTFLGLPLIVVVAALVIWRRRSPSVVAAATTMVVMGTLALGITVIVDREPTSLPSAYKLIADIPLIDAALPTRYALALLPLIAIIIVDAIDALAPAADRTRALPRVAQPVSERAAVAVPVAVAFALLPLFPLPLLATDREPVPAFITSGAWRECVPEGGVLVPVPLPTAFKPDAMRWPAAANNAFGIPEGFFFGPYGDGGKRTTVGTYPQPTSQLLTKVANGNPQTVTDAERARARADLEFWGADCVALSHVPRQEELRATLEQLLGPGTLRVDTWTWQITR